MNGDGKIFIKGIKFKSHVHQERNWNREQRHSKKEKCRCLRVIHEGIVSQIEFYINPNVLIYIKYEGFPGGSECKESVCNTGDPRLIPGLGRYPGEENSNLLQHSYLENPMDRGA